MIWELSKKKVQILPLEEIFVEAEEVEEDEEELEHVQFHEPPMEVIQFKVILCAPQ